MRSPLPWLPLLALACAAEPPLASPTAAEAALWDRLPASPEPAAGTPPSSQASFHLDFLLLQGAVDAPSPSQAPDRWLVAAAPRLTVFADQDAVLRMSNQTAYIRDFEVQISSHAAIADPVVEVLDTGLQLTARVETAGGELRCRLQIQRVELDGFTDQDAGLGPEASVQLPRLRRQELALELGGDGSRAWLLQLPLLDDSGMVDVLAVRLYAADETPPTLTEPLRRLAPADLAPADLSSTAP